MRGRTLLAVLTVLRYGAYGCLWLLMVLTGLRRLLGAWFDYH